MIAAQMLSLLLLILTACSANELSMRHFLRAMRRGEHDEARRHLPAMEDELALLCHVRLGAPSASRLLREVRVARARTVPVDEQIALERLVTLVHLYVSEVKRLMAGFMQARDLMMPTAKMTALYHLRDTVRTTRHLTEQERQALMDDITAVTPRTPLAVYEELRNRLCPLYDGGAAAAEE